MLPEAVIFDMAGLNLPEYLAKKKEAEKPVETAEAEEVE